MVTESWLTVSTAISPVWALYTLTPCIWPGFGVVLLTALPTPPTSLHDFYAW